jgi:hypothetical protein
VQRDVLAYLRAEPFGRDHGEVVTAATWWITEHVYGYDGDDDDRRHEAQASEPQRSAVRRALAGLERAGLVERVGWRGRSESGQTAYWRAVPPEVPAELAAGERRRK